MNHGSPEPAKPLQAQAKSKDCSSMPAHSFDTSNALNCFCTLLWMPVDFCS